MSFPCAVSRDLARFEAEQDAESEYDEALTLLRQTELFDAIESLDIDPVLRELVGEILDSDETVDNYFKERLCRIAEQAAIDEAEAAGDHAQSEFDAGWYCA